MDNEFESKKDTKSVPLPGAGSSASFGRVLIFLSFVIVGLVAWAVGSVNDRRTAKIYSMQKDTVRVPEYVYIPCPQDADSLAGRSVPDEDAKAFLEEVYVSGYVDAIKDITNLFYVSDSAERERRIGRLEDDVIEKARSKDLWKSVRGQ